MNKLYSVHDHWTDINKKNDVDIESIDGVIAGIKVNGEDYGGGGGSSDFSTANVTIVVPPTFDENPTWNFAYILDFPRDIGGGMSKGDYIVRRQNSPDIKTVILYKGKAGLYAPVPTGCILNITGNITVDDIDYYIITGDCTITLAEIPK